MMTSSKRLPLYVAGGAGLSALAVILGLTTAHSGAKQATVSTMPQSTVVATRGSALGQILVDSRGRTLYLFANDTSPASTCYGSCASYWPPAPASGAPHASGGATAASVGIITRSDGSKQLSYAGHPLYYFAGDTKAGQISGQGLNQFGAKWFVLNSTGGAVTSSPTAAASTAGSGRGYGY
jgi:predicted lipoprotein with Yx(FWY)xxD motif